MVIASRPIGAVIYMQGRNLKMSLRSLDPAVDTSEVAKVFLVISFVANVKQVIEFLFVALSS